MPLGNEYMKKYRVQVICTPLCRDIIEYKKLVHGTPESKQASEILSDHFNRPENVPPGFWEWRKKKNGL